MSHDANVVEVTNLSKTFKIPIDKASGIKQLIIKFARRKKQGYREFNVLDDINFEIKKGEFFGIVGRNGSGKSTLLKLIAGIYTPNNGVVRVNGSLTPFIELGVGFNPELTGRENIFLNGALLGFSRDEMGEMYDEIVEFSELKDFMEERLKNYSSGMQVRLAFAIAVRAKSDILLIDEVLAVGDSAFQQKCFDYFDQLKREKRTIVFISHDMSAVKRYCDRCILVEKGKVILEGNPEKIAREYDNLNLDKIASASGVKKNTPKAAEKVPISIITSTIHGKKANKFNYLDTMRVSLSWSDDRTKSVGITIFKSNEYVYGTNTFEVNIDPSKKNATLSVRLNLGPGKYRLGAGMFADDKGKQSLFYLPDGPEFVIREGEDTTWGGITKLKSDWRQTNEEVQ